MNKTYTNKDKGTEAFESFSVLFSTREIVRMSKVNERATTTPTTKKLYAESREFLWKICARPKVDLFMECVLFSSAITVSNLSVFFVYTTMKNENIIHIIFHSPYITILIWYYFCCFCNCWFGMLNATQKKNGMFCHIWGLQSREYQLNEYQKSFYGNFVVRQMRRKLMLILDAFMFKLWMCGAEASLTTKPLNAKHLPKIVCALSVYFAMSRDHHKYAIQVVFIY